MQRRPLGHSDIHVSEIGFGCMSIGTDQQTASALLHFAFDQGVRFFDTADLYDQGRNEEIIGKAFAKLRHEVVLATKVGNRFETGKPGWTWDPSPRYIRQAVENSLRRLQTDYIDLYQLHGGTMEDPFDGIVELMERLREEGKIRAYGISSIRPNVILRYLAGSNIDSVMMQYSLLDRRPEEWFPTLAEHGVSVIARGPVARGLLSNLEKPFGDEERYVDRNKQEVESARGAIRALVNPSRTAGQTSLRYTLHPSVVASAIPGASGMLQLSENVDTANVAPLTPEETGWLQQAVRQNSYAEHRPLP
ncbi:aldo/keto reductase [Alicyclobacillus fastidiosus]|uniref:Aldo/keto reductase n=1 Tax=Alicyclobacillus fastidiosus TaxID=392011 RepID=A0ABV5AHD4_9BACL|nr:aldo/keto reductase [Alicyclobacillus fastidiosus]WEH09214.1 aldo/keto reductase [Alicyclobacillus fastidiosus]